MTEEEWLHGVNRTTMMNWLRRGGTQRQFYLAGCAAVRQFWDQLPDQPYRNLIRLVEQYADGLLNPEELRQAHRAAETAAFEENLELQNQGLRTRRLSKRMAPVFAAVHASMAEAAWESAISAMEAAQGAEKRVTAWAEQCAILRDIFGNPFRSVPAVHPSWLAWHDATVPRIAQSIYEQYTFEHLPILADALEEAGCDNAVILDHCRQPAKHVRGCWLLDTLLQKMDTQPRLTTPSLFPQGQEKNKTSSRRRRGQSHAVILPLIRPS
jgi:hypothetical protein